jgi:hypothetical protein
MITQRLNFIWQCFGTLCSIFIGSVRRKNNQDEIVGVFLQEKGWLENSLSQLEVGGSGREHIRVEKRAVEVKDPNWRPVIHM